MNKNFVNRSGLDLFKEVLWVAVGQRTANLQAIIVGDLKKFCRSARVKAITGSPGSSPAQSDDPQSLTFHNFAAL